MPSLQCIHFYLFLPIRPSPCYRLVFRSTSSIDSWISPLRTDTFCLICLCSPPPDIRNPSPFAFESSSCWCRFSFPFHPPICFCSLHTGVSARIRTLCNLFARPEHFVFSSSSCVPDIGTGVCTLCPTCDPVHRREEFAIGREPREKSQTWLALLVADSCTMPTAPRMPRWMPALRNRRGTPSRQHHAASAASMQPNSTLPPRLRKRDILLRGPQLLLRGPSLLLRAPQVVWRAPAAARAGTRRFLSGTALRSRQQPQQRPQGIDELSRLHAETSKTAAPTNASEPTQEEARQSFASASAAFIERPRSLSNLRN